MLKFLHTRRRSVYWTVTNVLLWVHSNSSSDTSKHSEESDIRSLADSDHYCAHSETTAPINLSTL